MRVALLYHRYYKRFRVLIDVCKVEERRVAEGRIRILSIFHYVSSRIATCTLCKLRRGRARGSEQNGYVNINYDLYIYI